MPRKLLLPLMILAISSVYLYTSTRRAILDDGDALYATVAKQMIERRDWVTPYANGVRFLDKPPMMYWLMGAAYAAFGTNEFAARLPTVLAVLGIGLLLYRAGSRVSGPAGFVAGMAAAFCVGTFLFTRMVFPDMLFVFFLTLALCTFLEWYSDPASPTVPAMFFYAALAGAVLTKSLIGIVFPGAIVLAFLTWERAWLRLKRFHLVEGGLLFLALALPWHGLAALRNPGFLWYFFVNEQFLRFVGMRQPVDYESISVPLFWALVLVWLFPWSAFLPAIRPVLQEARSRGGEARALVKLSLSWVIVVLGFFTFSSRIEHYSLPLIPPLAILTGFALAPDKFVDAGAQLRRARLVNRGFACLAVLGGLIGLALCGLFLLWTMGDWGLAGNTGNIARHIRAYDFYFAPVFDLPPQLVAGLRAPLLGTGLAFALGLTCSWWMNRRGRLMPAVLLLSGMMAVFCLFAYQSLGICEAAISSRQFGRALGRLYQPGDSAITVGDFEAANSVNFYAPMPLEVYGGTADVLAWGLRYPGAPSCILTRNAFESRWNGPRRTFLLVADHQVSGLHLGRSFDVLRSAGRTLLCNQPVAWPIQPIASVRGR